MSIAVEPENRIYLDLQNLRHEYGWPEVAKGLGRILLGYVLLMVGLGVIVALIGYTAVSLKARHGDKTALLIFEVACMVGLGLAFLLLLACGWMIGKGGYWRCLKYSPERYGAKWMIFTSMTCLTMGTALNMSCSFAGVQRQPEFRKGPDGFQMPEFDPNTRIMQLACTGVGLASFVLFMGYLRAVALCFNHQSRGVHVVIFLCYFGLLWGGSYYLVITKSPMLTQPRVLLALGVGWVVAFFWKLLLIFLVRASVTWRLELVRSPLEM
jgi:hypothetical protein